MLFFCPSPVCSLLSATALDRAVIIYSLDFNSDQLIDLPVSNLESSLQSSLSPCCQQGITLSERHIMRPCHFLGLKSFSDSLLKFNNPYYRVVRKIKQNLLGPLGAMPGLEQALSVY